MDFLSSPELTLALAAAAGALVANSSKWLLRWVGNYVKGTPNKLDDRIFAAVKKAIYNEFETRQPRSIR